MTETASFAWRVLLSMLCLWTVQAAESVEKPGVSVIELGANNFTQELSTGDVSKGHCLIEFYAHWCPHCQHYKPLYERIGRFFNGEPRPEPHIWVLRLDCALKQNIPVCDTYKVAGYPTIYLGKAEAFLRKQIDQLIQIPAKDPSSVVEYINSKLHVHYVFEEKTTLLHIQPKIGKREESAMQFDKDDVERATVELFEHVFGSMTVLSSTRVREAFIDWVKLLAMAHPSQRCRGSCRYLLKNMEELWPKTADHPLSLMSRLKICSVSYSKKDWGSCAGSLENTRGFTCGLWQLLHALSVDIDDSAVDQWMKGVKAFAKYFFGCAECAKHFYSMLQQDYAKAVKKKTNLVLWLWSTHNKVNKRLAKEELQQGTGDPSFPKVQWPPNNLCSTCREGVSGQGVQWNEASVKEFLMKFYSAVNEPEVESRSGRKELIAGSKELVSTDVFSKEDATAIELKNARSSRLSLYVFVVLLGIIIYVARKQRKRKIFPRRKDLV